MWGRLKPAALHPLLIAPHPTTLLRPSLTHRPHYHTLIREYDSLTFDAWRQDGPYVTPLVPRPPPSSLPPVDQVMAEEPDTSFYKRNITTNHQLAGRQILT